ncbi:RNA polymerase I-specific transcription initiation factor RRN3-like isoform X2 [Corticium candelabrum]|uniref:RNA polymerase I-specific transcription initiation factor RRN3-like isoform X2 n=1 Tax=Corticium candelabrum TaxID=121492 RepID=UPI002E3499F1|nr:RNA polymerase I-specific transcription initiation factor RRN3-like isoform X2 [Corticium candelabrum]
MASSCQNAAVIAHVISEALHKKSKGDSSEYNIILTELSRSNILDVSLSRWLDGLKCCASVLGKGFEDLVGITLDINWIYKDDQFVADYTEYLTSLLSANPVYLSPCIRKLVSLMKPETQQDPGLKLVFERVHQMLNVILKLAPGGLRIVQKMIQELFPYKQKSAFILECYVMNLFRLLEYAPSLTPVVWELIVNKLIQIDTELPNQSQNEVLDDENGGDEKDQSQFQEEINDDHVGDITPYSWPDPDDTCDLLSHKLDVLMSRCLCYCYYCCHPKGVFSFDDSTRLFYVLLEIFKKCLLPTHGSSYPQFLCFYVCSYHKTFCEEFLLRLWTTVESVSLSATVRQAAAAYIGSFAARAKYLPLSCVKTVLELLVGWIHRYVDQFDHLSSGADSFLHGPFYAVCQAVFYIFVFRHKQLLNAESDCSGLSYLQSLNLGRVVSCHLNPLMVCLDSVVNMFATLTRNYQIAFCYTVLERNRRVLVPQHGHQNLLDIYTKSGKEEVCLILLVKLIHTVSKTPMMNIYKSIGCQSQTTIICQEMY